MIPSKNTSVVVTQDGSFENCRNVGFQQMKPPIWDWNLEIPWELFPFISSCSDGKPNPKNAKKVPFKRHKVPTNKLLATFESGKIEKWTSHFSNSLGHEKSTEKSIKMTPTTHEPKAPWSEQKLVKKYHTLPETGSKFATENRPSQKEIHLPTIHFQVFPLAGFVSGSVDFCILGSPTIR